MDNAKKSYNSSSSSLGALHLGWMGTTQASPIMRRVITTTMLRMLELR